MDSLRGPQDTEFGSLSFSYLGRGALLRVLQGVSVATKTQSLDLEPLNRLFSAHTNLDLLDWNALVNRNIFDVTLKQLAYLALAVTFFQESSRQELGSGALERWMSFIWKSLINTALTLGSSSTRPSILSVSRSSQGFLAIPLCVLLEDGKIDELFRIHIWLPDGQRGNPLFAIHSHQTFSHSWVLAGEGRDQTFKTERCKDQMIPTHAEYSLAWSDGASLDTNYKTHQNSSTVTNTGELVVAAPTASAAHTRDSSCTVPAGEFHMTEVAPDRFHATMFFFDSKRGFVKDARVLGPKDEKFSTHIREGADFTARELCVMATSLRNYEIFLEKGREHAHRAEWEFSFNSFNSALNLCETTENFPNASFHKSLVFGELGNSNRQFGRYEQAKDCLEKALSGIGLNLQHVKLSGELGVVFRHMDRLEDAKRAFEDQYNTAKHLEYDQGACRAIGNLGMVNYQLSQAVHDGELLDLAIEQLSERVRRARRLIDIAKREETDNRNREGSIKRARTWESIGLNRLSLAFTARRDSKAALAAALESQNLTRTSEDPTVRAMSRFYYGRALLADNRTDEALAQFNSSGTCSCAMALCMEPSREHCGYLQELVEIGADLIAADEQGYTALDYATFNGSKESQDLVLLGIRRNLEGGVDQETKLLQFRTEAALRKGYRELFQEKLRPALLDKSANKLQKMRLDYASTLKADPDKQRMFDELKYIAYSDFLRFGRLPRSSDGLARPFAPERMKSTNAPATDFIIFFSYRWINKSPGAVSPDDEDSTQYRRMVEATEAFLKLYRKVDRDKLGIWMDFACVNQDDPMSGVSALPMNLAQCDAMISLIDDEYYSRAWCSVEVMMAKTLRDSYLTHIWYEHVLHLQTSSDGTSPSKSGYLRLGPLVLEIEMKDKLLTYETDRPKVLFLERQSKLLA
ncbi:hypothetical protein K402DRAFT_452852 [Aulographum hederae CBS 113979]|uniref:Uncharacterized protein n=1 Tax=Aulographum hederae CBS 113979 TaxID=1176131 RepID=A0A6G1H6G7_9PEZI|nr:hypothetical protein K402DRAFT_452852 [Aulographum hederae CBS 113979]